MEWLRQHKRNPDRLSDLLPWAALVAPGCVLNKNGTLQKTLSYRGPDLDSATESELVTMSARINNVLKRFGGGWAMYAEATRAVAEGYPSSEFPDPVTHLIEQERRSMFEELSHYESSYKLTFLYMPPSDTKRKIAKFFVEQKSTNEIDYQKVLDNFLAEIDRAKSLLSGSLQEVRELDDEQTLTYLHSTCSENSHRIRVPEIPMYLDSVLADCPLVTGTEPRLGNQHIRTISIKGFPGTSQPGILDLLNRLPIEYRWVTRFIWLDKPEAVKEISSYRRKWFAKRKDFFTILRETLLGAESIQVDNDAVNKAHDADQALQELQDDAVAFGYFATFVVLRDSDDEKLNTYTTEVERIINSLGFATHLESHNAVDAWLASIPGNCKNFVRKPHLNTMNLAHLMPGISSVWAGPEKDEHLDAPVILEALTNGSTKFRFTTKVGDVGHATLFGPTGSGKSFKLNLMQAQFRRYPGAQIYVFDKGGSSRVLCTAAGGDFFDLGAENSELAFQPLANIDNLSNRRWAHEWVLGLIQQQNVQIDPKIKEAVWVALNSLGSAPREERTLFGLMVLLQDASLRSALLPFTIEGQHGGLLDSSSDTLGYNSWQVFEMEKLMETPSVVMPVLQYLFYRIEQRLDGRPTLLILDEAWKFLENSLFEKKIREWLKVLRKANCSVIFGTQSLADITESKIVATLKEACFTKIYLPNATGRNEDQKRFYTSFGLNERQIQIITEAHPKREYYYTSPLGNRLYELGAGDLTRAYCGATSKKDQVEALELLKSCNDLNMFNREFMRMRGLDWAADSLNYLIEEEKEAA